MPNETINYKVNVDTSSLADQLQQIKSQVDQAMATYTFNATRPDPVPLSYAFPSQQFTSQIAQASSITSSAALEAGRTVGTAIQQIDAQTSSFMDTARMGFQKFTHDVQNAMLMTAVGAPTQFAQQLPGMPPPQFQTMSGARLGLEAITGFGYDTSYSMTPGRYQRLAREAFSDRSVEMFLGGLDMAAGGTAIGGFAAGMLGMTGTATALGAAAAVLAPPALLAGVGMASFGYDVNAAMRGRAFMRDSSPRFLSGQFNSAETAALGTQIAAAGRSPELVGRGISQGEAMENVQLITQMGGYDFVRNASELSTRIKNDIKDLTDVQRILGVTKEEAARMLIDANRLGIRPTENVAASIQAQAYQAGYTGAEFNKFGLQAAEMARGTGIMMGSAYFGGQDALADIRNMMRTGAIPFELINQLGGQENAAATITRMGSNFGLSQTGLTYFAARDLLGPKAASMDPLQTIAAATQRIQSVPDFLNFRGAQARMTGQVGPEALFNAETAMFLNEFKLLQQATPNLQLNEDTWAGFMAQKGEADPIARLRFSMIGSAARGEGAKRAGGEDAERMRILDENRPGSITVLTDIAKNLMARTFKTEEVAQGANEMSNWFDRTVRTIERSGQRGEILGGFLDAIVPGLGSAARGLGYDTLNLTKIAYDEKAVVAGLSAMTPETQRKFFGNTFDRASTAPGIIARDVLGLGTTDIYDVQGKLAAIPGGAILPFTDGTPDQRFTSAMNEWRNYSETFRSGQEKGENNMAGTEKQAFEKARAVMLATGSDPAKFVAAITNPVGIQGEEIRKFLGPMVDNTKRKSSLDVAENIKGIFNAEFNKAFPLTTVTSHPGMSAAAPGLGQGTNEVDLLSARGIFKRMGIDETEGQSMAQSLITKFNTLGATEFQKQLFGATSNIGSRVEREERVKQIFSKVEELMARPEIKQLESVEVLNRLNASESAKDYIVDMGKAMGMKVTREELSNAAGIRDVLLRAPGQLQKLAINYADAATYMSTTGGGKNTMDESQKTLRANIAQSEVAVWDVVRGMNADLSTVTPQQLKDARDMLMVSSLRTIANAVNAGTGGSAMNVKVVSDISGK